LKKRQLGELESLGKQGGGYKKKNMTKEEGLKRAGVKGYAKKKKTILKDKSHQGVAEPIGKRGEKVKKGSEHGGLFGSGNGQRGQTVSSKEGRKKEGGPWKRLALRLAKNCSLTGILGNLEGERTSRVVR